MGVTRVAFLFTKSLHSGCNASTYATLVGWTASGYPDLPSVNKLELA